MADQLLTTAHEDRMTWKPISSAPRGDLMNSTPIILKSSDWVIVPRTLSTEKLRRLAYFDMDSVGNGPCEAAEELWAELIKNPMEVMRLEFSNPVFHRGVNTTVRRGLKWSRVDKAVVRIGDIDCMLPISSLSYPFHLLDDHHLRNEHDPTCRTVTGLLAELRRVYPGFQEGETVTLVNFTLPGIPDMETDDGR